MDGFGESDEFNEFDEFDDYELSERVESTEFDEAFKSPRTGGGICCWVLPSMEAVSILEDCRGQAYSEVLGLGRAFQLAGARELRFQCSH